MLRVAVRDMGRYREIQGDTGRYREIQGDIGRYREIWDRVRVGLRVRTAQPEDGPEPARDQLSHLGVAWLGLELGIRDRVRARARARVRV